MPRRPTGKRSKADDGSWLVHGKAANGEGSIYPRTDGRWTATFRDATGQTRTVSARTRELVLAKRAAALEDVRNQAPTRFDRSTTVAALADWWLVNVASTQVRASSLAKYEDRVGRIKNGLGTAAVAELRPEHVQAWLTKLQRDGLAAKTAADTRVTLRQVLSVAVAYGLAASNVTEAVKPPRGHRYEARALTPEEARRLIAAAASDRFGATVALLFVQGWRVSEVLGLAWEDIDFDARTAMVQRAAVYVDGQGPVLGPPKTAGSRGLHHLAPGVLALLELRRRIQQEERRAAAGWLAHVYDGEPVELVFTTKDGGIVNRQAITKLLARGAAFAGVDPKRLGTHVGRRTVVTTLYAEEGVDLADMARHVGHTSTTTTAGYVRSVGDRPKTTVDAAARHLDVVPDFVQ
jgi:integrase